jgi:catechol 2,3-dioxygenase-like lactoylglutathione lyase family enzyme
VGDLQRALRFYRDGLGLPTTWDRSKVVVFFQTRGACLALYPYDELAKDDGPPLEAFGVVACVTMTLPRSARTLGSA